MPYGGIYNTELKKCVLPHYKNAGSDNDDNVFYKNWPINRIFEKEISTYKEYGNTMCSCINGICHADLFYQYGIYMKDDYMNSVFSNVSCFRGKHTSISYMVAGRPYKINYPPPSATTSICSENVVFPKGCLIVPRGELLWSLLAIPGERIGATDNPHNFKIYVHKVTENGAINSVTSTQDEFKSHLKHLNLKDTVVVPKTADAFYVTLNPFIYMRIKAYKCMSPENRSLEEQYFMIHKMNLLYTQTLAAMSLIPVEARRLLMYPPGTKESICSDKDTLYVGVPSDFQSWTLKESGANNKAKNGGYTYTGNLPKNTIVFPDAKSGNECETTNTGFHNFIQQYERSHLTKVRDEYVDLIEQDIGIPEYFDLVQMKYWYKLIKNTHPTKLKFENEDICTYTPNCTLTPLGVVATRRICENDPLIFDIHTMQIDQLNVPNAGNGFQCNLEGLDMPMYQSITDVEKIGENMRPKPKVQANPMSFTSQFVTSLGTNITILPYAPIQNNIAQPTASTQQLPASTVPSASTVSTITQSSASTVSTTETSASTITTETIAGTSTGSVASTNTNRAIVLRTEASIPVMPIPTLMPPSSSLIPPPS